MFPVIILLLSYLSLSSAGFTDIRDDIRIFNDLKRRTRDGAALNYAASNGHAKGPWTNTDTNSITEQGLSKSTSKSKATDAKIVKGSYYYAMSEVYDLFKTGGKDQGKEFLEQAAQSMRGMSWRDVARALLDNKLDGDQYEEFKEIFIRRDMPSLSPSASPSPMPVGKEQTRPMEAALEQALVNTDTIEKPSNEDKETEVKDLLKKVAKLEQVQEYMINTFIDPLVTYFLNGDGTFKNDLKIDKEDLMKFKKLQDGDNKRFDYIPPLKEAATEQGAVEGPESSVTQQSPTDAEPKDADGVVNEGYKKETVEYVPETESYRYTTSAAQSSRYISTVRNNDTNEAAEADEPRIPEPQVPRYYSYLPPGYYPSGYLPPYWGYPQWNEFAFQPEVFESGTTKRQRYYYSEPSNIEVSNTADASAEADGEATFTDAQTDTIADQMSKSSSVAITESVFPKKKICLKFEQVCFCNNVDKCIKKKNIEVCKRNECTLYGPRCSDSFCVESKCRVFEKDTYKCVESFCVKYNSDQCTNQKYIFERCLEYNFECKTKEVCEQFVEDCIPHCERVCVKQL